MKLVFTIIKNLVRHYWKQMLVVFAFLWIGMSFIGGMVGWKAVFLDNNEVYFGRYYRLPFSQFATIRDVYFLRGGTTTDAAIIVPLSSEPHGPKDSMRVNVQHVRAVHVLRNDSPLVQTIENTAQEQ